MAHTPWVLGEQFATDGSLPPWDGTGVPLPVDDNGWPVIPDGERVLRITEPVDGATVDPLVTIRGRGAPDGATVDLYVDSSPGAPVATTTAAADGSFEFVGSTPLDVATETLTVGVGADRSAPVTVTVNLPVQAQSAEATQAGESVASVDEEYDPSAHTVAEVQAYLAEHPDQTDYVLDRERAGKARTTLIGD